MAWYESTKQKSAVREYRSRTAMQRDIEKATAYGWQVAAVSEVRQRVGCLRIVMTGFLALIWKPPSHFLVTYSRVAENAAAG